MVINISLWEINQEFGQVFSNSARVQNIPTKILLFLYTRNGCGLAALPSHIINIALLYIVVVKI